MCVRVHLCEHAAPELSPLAFLPVLPLPLPLPCPLMPLPLSPRLATLQV
jgi:hypothetical protein